MSESILNKLREEHRQVAQVMSQIEECQDVVRKKELYLLLKEILIPHMEGEEQTLYSHLRNDVHDEEAEELAEHAGEEHREVKFLFAKLDNIGIESDEWDSTFAEMKAAVEKHVDEEESELFTEAKEDFSKEELMEFADDFDEIKHHTSL
jgi:hemerythrin-like domain-containing protein